MIWFSCVLFPAFFLAASALPAQRGPDWKKANDRKDHYEGTYSRPVGNADMELVSLTTGISPYPFRQGARLRVRFYSPAASLYHLHAEDLSGTQFYWWEDKNGQAKQGWYASPADWQVDFLLSKLNIGANNLGVLTRLGAPSEQKFAPAQVYTGTAVPAITRYVAVLRLGRPTASGEYKVHRGESRSGPLLFTKSVTARSGGSSLALSLPAASLPASGWVFVEVNLKEQRTMDPFTYSFRFYVPARP